MQKIISGIVFFSLLISSQAAYSVTQNDDDDSLFKNGKDYFAYVTPIEMPPLPNNQILIQEFFSYECPVCLNTYDILQLYGKLNSGQVVIKREPVATEGAKFTPNVFYTLELMGRNDLAALLLFDSASQKGRNSLVNSDNLSKWLAQHGINLDSFEKTLNSPEVTQLGNRAIDMTEKYGIFTVPFVVLDGKYVLTRSTLYNDDYSFAVLDFLRDKLKSEQSTLPTK